jgi:hypothetical protein
MYRDPAFSLERFAGGSNDLAVRDVHFGQERSKALLGTKAFISGVDSYSRHGQLMICAAAFQPIEGATGFTQTQVNHGEAR